MSDEQWQQVKELFHAALERDPTERSLCLRNACQRDENLLQEIKKFISAHEKSDDFIQNPIFSEALVYITSVNNGKEERELDSNEVQIFVAHEDGSNEKQLTSEGEHNLHPLATSDGKYILFISDQNKSNKIIRMNIDGSNPVQLSKTVDIESGLQVTSDSRTLIFTESRNKMRLMKTLIEGTNSAELVPESQSSDSFPRISPDGKYLAYLSNYYHKATSKFKDLVTVAEFYNGEVGDSILEEFEFASTMQWSPDSKSLCFIKREEVDNLWCYSIADQKVKALTNFDWGKITNFTWSPKGQKLLIGRSFLKNDLILLRDSDKTQ